MKIQIDQEKKYEGIQKVKEFKWNKKRPYEFRFIGMKQSVVGGAYVGSLTEKWQFYSSDQWRFCLDIKYDWIEDLKWYWKVFDGWSGL